jgi:hypothetical protein
MATLANTARSAACDAIVDLVDGGAGAGRFFLQDGGDAGDDLAVINLNDPAFDAASNGTAALDVSPVPSATASASGTADTWKITRSDNDTAIISGTIGTGSEDLDIDNTSVTSGQTVNITSLSVTVPAS